MTILCQEAVLLASTKLPCHTKQVALLLLRVTWTTAGDSHWLRETCKPKHKSVSYLQLLCSLY